MSSNIHSQEVYSDLLSFTFDGPKPYNQNQPLFIDAEDPSRSFTGVQFRQLVRTLVAGLKAHNVQPGDCVLLHLGNSVSERNNPKKKEEKKIIQIENIKNESKIGLRTIADSGLSYATDTISRTVFRYNWRRRCLHGIKPPQPPPRTRPHHQPRRTQIDPHNSRCPLLGPRCLWSPGHAPSTGLPRGRASDRSLRPAIPVVRTRIFIGRTILRNEWRRVSQ